MKCMGFSNGVTKWFECYLSKRMFSVHVENSFSDKAIIICGVPKGSILGPMLFLLYVNDMVQAVNCDILLYADDTGLIFQHKDINIIRGGSRTAATSKMERFVIIVNGWKPLTIITKRSILDVAAVLDPPLIIEHQLNRNFSNICDWFVDNKLSIHFGEDKTKSIFFGPLNKCKKVHFSLISIIHAQFGTPTLTKNSKLNYKLFKTNVYVSAFN